MNTYRIGIAGAGFGVKAHLPALLAHPRFEVVALASPSSAAAIAKERGIPHAFTSTREMIDGCELDVVTLAAPPFTHRDDVLYALDAAKHVVCEKPLALNVEEAEELVAASRDAATACAIAHEFRYVPERIAIKELIDNGHLSPLRNIEMTQLTTSLRVENHDRARGWWFERARGGGIAQAQFSHLIDAANWFAGRTPRRLAGFLRTANPVRRDAEGEFRSTVDDGTFATLDYGDGLVARLCCDATSNVDSFTLAVHSEQRTAVASGENVIETTLYTVDADETNELQCKPSPHAKFASIQPNVPLLMDLYDDFIRLIETGSSGLATFQDGLDTQRVLAELGYTTPS